MKIEKVSTDDAHELLSIYAPYVKNTAISFEYTVPTVDEFKTRIENISRKFPYIKAVQNGEIQGYAYANTFKARAAYNRTVEVTIYVRQDCRRNGVGKALYTQLEKSLVKMGVLNMNACIASIDEYDEHLNNDSYNFHKKLKFEFVGCFHKCGYKFGKWYNMIWMEKIIGNHDKNPKEISSNWEL